MPALDREPSGSTSTAAPLAPAASTVLEPRTIVAVGPAIWRHTANEMRSADPPRVSPSEERARQCAQAGPPRCSRSTRAGISARVEATLLIQGPAPPLSAGAGRSQEAVRRRGRRHSGRKAVAGSPAPRLGRAALIRGGSAVAAGS
jgi:hypothetical protein